MKPSLGFAGADSKHPRVLRGGAFNNNSRNARCSARNNNNPDNRNNNIGFRVVVSTLFRTPALLGGTFILPSRGEEWQGLLLAASCIVQAGRIATAPPPRFMPWGGANFR